MTLTIPTAELVGAITDVAPMAWPDDEIPAINVVRVELDDEHLHTMATDRYRIGWSRWKPDDDPDDGEPVQEELFVDWGWDDPPWSCSLRLDDAQHAVKVFGLPAKQGRVPLTVEHDLGTLTVRRSAESGHPAYTAVYETVTDEFPNVRRTLQSVSTLDSVQHIGFTARYLADFGKVRPHGPLELFFTGPTKPAHVRIGDRFTGAIMPCRIDTEGPVDHATLRSAADLVILTQHASKDMLAKRLHITASRATGLLEALQQHGIVKTVGAGDWQVTIGEDDREQAIADLDERLGGTPAEYPEG